jgi:ankyrin repeat protein
MHFAVSNSNLKLINFLSSKGASVLLKNKNGIYPIDIAAEGNNTDLMQYLAKLGNYMRFNQIISTSQKKEDDLESDQEKENILDYKIDDNILKQKSFQSFPSFNFDKSNIKDSKKSSLNIDSINFESGMENNFDKSKRSIISREERSKFSKTNNSKKKSFGIGEGEIQASEKKITKKRKKKNSII